MVKTYARKRVYRPKAKKMVKKSYKRTGRITYPKAVQGIPNKLVTHLVYCDTFELGNGSTVVTSKTYRANSVYDPDYSGIGHQPLYFDQYSAMYQNYKVTKTKIIVDATTDTGSNAANGILVGLDILTSDNTVDLDPNVIKERPHSNYRTLTYQIPMRRLSGGWNIRRSIAQGEDNLTSACNANPGYVEYIRVYGMATDGSTVIPNASVNVNVKIIYTVEFFGLVQVLGS